MATGLEIEIIDIHSEEKARLILEGHTERIRSLAMMARKSRVIAKSKNKGTQVLNLNTDFLISVGDDKSCRIWRIPPPISSR